jgi:hypothetical protein
VEPEIFAPRDPANRRGKRKVHHALAWSWGRQHRAIATDVLNIDKLAINFLPASRPNAGQELECESDADVGMFLNFAKGEKTRYSLDFPCYSGFIPLKSACFKTN